MRMRVVLGGRPRRLLVISLGANEVDVQQHRLSIDGTPATLTQKEYALAVYFFQSPGKLLSRDHLLNEIWGIDAEVDTRTVATQVSRLRKKPFLDGAKGWRLTRMASSSATASAFRSIRSTRVPMA